MNDDMHKIMIEPRTDIDIQARGLSRYFDIFHGTIYLLQMDTTSVLYGFEDIFQFQSLKSTKLITFFADPELQEPLCAPWFDVEVITDRAPIDPVIGPADGYQMSINQQNSIRWYQARTGKTRVLVRFSMPREGRQKIARRLSYCIIEEPPDEIDEEFLDSLACTYLRAKLKNL